jgi:hypothetical protein
MLKFYFLRKSKKGKQGKNETKKRKRKTRRIKKREKNIIIQKKLKMGRQRRIGFGGCKGQPSS